MREGIGAACAAAALAFIGCASSQTDHYEAMRAQLSRARAASAGSNEADPLAGTPVLTRSSLVEAVLARNPGLDSARSAWAAALARYPQETALPDPMLGYSLRPRSLGSDEVKTANDVDLSQALPFPGKLALRGERALAEADAAQNAVEAERVRLAAMASALFDQYWVVERALESNAQHVVLLDDAHQVALSRYSGGTGPEQDVLTAETEQAMLSHREIELGTERRILSERINALLHRPQELALPAAPRELEPAPSRELDTKTLVASALATRPELRAREAQIRAREADVALARREFLPDFTLKAGYETSWQETPLETVVGVEVNVPLQLGRRRAALEEANARLAREKSLLRSLEDRVRLEVASAVEQVRESQHLLHLSDERLLPAARDRVASARAGFSSGQASFLELVDAERSLRTAEQEQLEERANLSRRQAELSRVLGQAPPLQEEKQ